MTMPRAKRMTDAELFAEGERILAQDQSKFEWERVTTPVRNRNPPTTIRMSPTLVKRLDRHAKAQHRTRSSLIQHVLWEYVFAQDGIPDGSKAAKPKATAARANGKKVDRAKARALKA